MNTDDWNMYMNYWPNAIIWITNKSTNTAMAVYLMQGHHEDH